MVNGGDGYVSCFMQILVQAISEGKSQGISVRRTGRQSVCFVFFIVSLCVPRPGGRTDILRVSDCFDCPRSFCTRRVSASHFLNGPLSIDGVRGTCVAPGAFHRGPVPAVPLGLSTPRGGRGGSIRKLSAPRRSLERASCSSIQRPYVPGRRNEGEDKPAAGAVVPIRMACLTTSMGSVASLGNREVPILELDEDPFGIDGIHFTFPLYVTGYACFDPETCLVEGAGARRANSRAHLPASFACGRFRHKIGD